MRDGRLKIEISCNESGYALGGGLFRYAKESGDIRGVLRGRTRIGGG